MYGEIVRFRVVVLFGELYGWLVIWQRFIGNNFIVIDINENKFVKSIEE